MKTYEQALFDAHKALVDDIDHKMPYKNSEYIAGMLDAARIILIMMRNERYNNENGGKQND